MAGSRFGRHLKWWFFTVPLIGVFLMPVIPDRAYFEIPDAEVQSVTAIIGQERANRATDNANALFRSAFIDSGWIRATVEATGDAAINDAGSSDFAHTWVRNFWLMIYRAVYRTTVMKLWLLGTVAFAVAAFVDGTVRRKIRAAAAGFASPLSFHVAAHGILLIMGVTLLVLIAPLAVLAQYWIGVAAFLGLLIWKAASSYQ